MPWLAVIATILVLAALREAASVAMPLVFSLFLVLLCWPLQRWLQARMPHRIAYVLTLGTLVGVSALFAWALIESVDEVVDRLPIYAPRLEGMVGQAREMLAARGLPLLQTGAEGSQWSGMAGGAARRALSSVVDLFGFVVLVTALCVLALREVEEFRIKFTQKLRTSWDAPIIDSFGTVITQLQQYVLTRCFTSGITGVITGLFAWAIGLELALTWGVLTFLLNFIPTLGTLAAVGAITLFALLQFQSVGMTLVVLVVLGLVQIVIGSYVDPRLQARKLSLSPFAVLVAVVFWGWMWGIPGALLGVPLTAALMIGFREFSETRWMAELLDNVRPEEAEAAPASPGARPSPPPPPPQSRPPGNRWSGK